MFVMWFEVKEINKGENKNNQGVFTLLSLAEEQSSLGTLLLSFADCSRWNCCNGENYSLIEGEKTSLVLMQDFKFCMKVINKRDFAYYLNCFP